MARVSADPERNRIQEVEVERLPPRGESAPHGKGSEEPSFASRARAAFDPVAAGLVVDLLDALTRGPVLAPFGFLLGVPLGYWLGRRAGLSSRRSLMLGLGVGAYCLLPMTGFIPAGTLVGLYLRFWAD